MENFELEAYRKFEKGHHEHQEPWDTDHIDAIAEAKGECLDLFNYGELMPEPLRSYVRDMARALWHELDNRQKEAPVSFQGL